MGAEAKGNNLIKDDPKIYATLIDGFCKGFTDSEACLSAGIAKGVLYSYIEQFPEFRDYKEEIKCNPILTAKTRVVSELGKDTQTAKWYLERKTKEFKPPDRSQGPPGNTLILLTQSQLQDRLANKLTKLLCNTNCNTDDEDVIEGEISDENN